MENKIFEVRYNSFTILDDDTCRRFIMPYFADIFEVDTVTNVEVKIGFLEMRLLLFGSAMNNGFGMESVFDMEEYTLRIGKQIANFDNEEVNDDILEFYKYDITENDICIIQSFEIIEKYRGKGIGKKIIKDLYIKFANSCGLFVVQTFPIQFEFNDGESLSEWEKQLNLKKLDKDFEKSFYKLKAFYQNLGFNHIDGYDDLMFLNPAIVNKKLGM